MRRKREYHKQIGVDGIIVHMEKDRRGNLELDLCRIKDLPRHHRKTWRCRENRQENGNRQRQMEVPRLDYILSQYLQSMHFFSFQQHSGKWFCSSSSILRLAIHWFQVHWLQTEGHRQSWDVLLRWTPFHMMSRCWLGSSVCWWTLVWCIRDDHALDGPATGPSLTSVLHWPQQMGMMMMMTTTVGFRACLRSWSYKQMKDMLMNTINSFTMFARL